MRNAATRVIFSVAVLGLGAACGTGDGTATTGRDASSNTTGATGTGAGGSGGATTGGSGGSGGSGTGGAGATGATTGSGGAAGSGATAGSGGAAGKGGSSGGTAGSAGGRTDAGAPSDARGANDVVDARIASDARASDASDAGGPADANARDVSIPDASIGDAGMTPYKGVANSPCGEMAMAGATWFYNWELGRGTCTAPEFIPMLWGNAKRGEQTPTVIANAMNTLVTQGFTTVLGFNEPDNTGQSNMTVATAISLWPSFNHPALRIGSPATSANAAGQAWFNDFMSQVNADTTGTLRVDFIAAHWYGWNAGSCEPNAATLETYIKGIEMIPGNRPIWLTEWGCMHMSNPDSATVVAFFKGAVAMFARHPRIERYAWYPWNPYNHLFVDGGISEMGTAFAAAPQYK
jgi:hypothetical protein